MQYANKRVTVMGLGTFGGGIGAARFLAQAGAQVTVTDLHTREGMSDSIAKLSDLPIRFVMGEHRMEDFRSADLVVVSPAVRENSPYLRAARRKGVPITQEINLFFEFCGGHPILAVTGTKGKSTTTALLGAMVRAKSPEALIGGNIGRSLLGETALMERRSIPVILELSSFQLSRFEGFSPDVAVVTNLAPEHLDWHGTFRAYGRAKGNIIRYQRKDAVAVLNYDDKLLRRWARWAPGRAVFYGLGPDVPGRDAAFLRGDELILRLAGSERAIARTEDVHLLGRHNLSNVLAASLAASLHGVETWQVADSLTRFRGLPHRLEMVASAPRNVRFCNDSIATNPKSAICALESFRAPITLIAGGYDKGAAFDDFARAVVSRVRRLFLIGQTADRIEAAVVAASKALLWGPKILRAENLEQACIQAWEGAVDDEVILLSPACASYGQFRNFEERGALFRLLAERLVGAKSVQRTCS